MNHINNNILRQVFLILFIAALSGLLFWNLRFFVPAVLGAYTIYMLFQKWMIYLTEQRKWRKELAATALLVLSFFVILVPIASVIRVLDTRVLTLVQNSPEILTNIETGIHQLEQRYQFEILTTDNIQSLGEWVATETKTVLNATLSGVATVLAMYFMLWFMLVWGKEMENEFVKWLPLKRENAANVRKQLNDLVVSNAIGIPVLGIIQGFFGLFAYWLADVNELGIWFLATCIAGMLPLFGAALAYVPLCLTLAAQGLTLKAGLLLLYGFVVIGSVDNIFRMWLLRRIGHTHPLVTLFGVIVGLKLFGFIGFVFGPIMIALLLLLLKIYNKEFSHDTAAS